MMNLGMKIKTKKETIDNECDLAICIPTFARPSNLKSRLNEINDSNLNDVPIYVYENSQTDDYQDAINSIGGLNVIHYTAAHNMGVERNLIRCYEETSSNWIWICGDDDPIHDGSIELLRESVTLAENQGCSFVLFGGNREKINSSFMLANSIDDIIDKFEFFDALLISNIVVNKKIFNEYIQLYCQSSFSMCPHLVVLLTMIGDGHKFLIDNRRLVGDSEAVISWSRLALLERSLSFLQFFSTHQKTCEWFSRYWCMRYALHRPKNKPEKRRKKISRLCFEAAAIPRIGFVRCKYIELISNLEYRYLSPVKKRFSNIHKRRL